MTDAAGPSDALLVIYAHSRPGVLAKIAAVFHRRALDIRTLTVGATRDAELAKIVVRVAAERPELQRIAAAIDNLVDVLAVELCERVAVEAHELCLVRLAAPEAAARAALLAAARPFAATVLDAGAESVVLELAAAPSVIDRFVETLAPFAVLDVSRTGATILPGISAPRLSGAAP